ncbi:TRAP transporter permease [Virgibacillus byunsanensis]|uniref:TRAP transporter permease n=1 Tax=Virgibacillus byunsanensis TaxID=570945 RepID=A0ABW3LFU7_9BACI
MRKLHGFTRIYAFIIGVSLTLITFYTAFEGVFLPMIQRSIHLNLILALVFLWFPARQNKSPRDRPSVLDYTLSILSILSLFWTLFNHPRFLTRILFYSDLSLLDMMSGIIIIVLTIEAGRRTMGWVLTSLSLIFICYGLFGQYMPSILSHSGLGIQDLVEIMYYSGDGLFGSLMGLSATILFSFIAFGTFLQGTNTDRYYMDISLAIAGNKAGGPAKVSVLSSAAMGSISGSTMANVVTTGTLTIPLMKKTGYKPHEAGAIETVASAAGQITPPIMGTGAFLMAEVIGVKYLDIMMVSIIPALIFFTTIWFFIDAKARKKGISGLDKNETPDLKKSIIRSWHLFLPIVILVIMLLNNFTPFIAGSVTTILIFIMAMLRKETRMGIKKLFLIIEKCSINMMMITGIIACAAIIVAVINQTGMMMKSTSIILSLSGGSLIITILLLALLSYILGMGLPVVTAYLILAALGAPALIELGIPALAAHLTIFWFSQLSTITPPVCMTAFAAAAIAKANPMRTGFNALKIGTPFYLVPILFLFTDILTGNWLTGIIVGISAMSALYMFSGSTEGYLFGQANKYVRSLGMLGFLCIFSSTFNLFSLIESLIILSIGILISLAIWVYQAKNNSRTSNHKIEHIG